jgi:putative FmdB family regulatory protein
MPLYDYRCENGHTFEVMQRMADAPITECEVCGAPVQRVLHPPAVHFKGSGFYTTDYGRKKSGGAYDTASTADSKSSDSKGSDSSKSSDSSKPSDSGSSAKKAETKSGSD